MYIYENKKKQFAEIKKQVMKNYLYICINPH